ncbi:MAG: M28 family peptidase [Planctomycetota bacterium]
MRLILVLVLALLGGCVASQTSREPVDLEAWSAVLPARLRFDVSELSGQYPGRHASDLPRLEASAEWLKSRLDSLGVAYRVEPFEFEWDGNTLTVENIVVDVAGTSSPRDVVVIGAHYDSVPQTPGADDNASGVAMNLALIAYFMDRPQPATLRFEFYPNEEAGGYWSRREWGSLRRAEAAVEAGENVIGMLSLEMLGFYTPDPVQPIVTGLTAAMGIETPADERFVAVASLPEHAAFVDRVAAAWEGPIPALGVASRLAVAYAQRSDNWSYWQAGIPAAIVTDTSELRNPNYHKPTDTADTLDYDAMAAVTRTLVGVIEELASAPAN